VIGLGQPLPTYECERCHRRNLAQPTNTPDGKLRFVCRCARGSWIRDYRLTLNAINAARDAGLSTVRV